ncbi:conjugal transfer protein TraD [Sphingomonas sp. MAH-20]|uniref:Conjugal transfer protein TraD n=2 Tax=Sphingomonadaceae TaxID=41297 RepID=A0A6I4IZA7_9SPHN|nr:MULTISPECIES: conjugal transfer protein TraD [Sphingomonas]MBA2920643.1 conjugal transfer protein TraD [Sphingomonas sp. CGMCC 1.13658]MVO77579.1 conjugal transfer protein TraD [Sphingomonas horti]
MRKPRDYDAELKALNERGAQLKQRKVQQLGELVIATGADALAIELLAGALVAAAKEKDTSVREGWRKAGAAFFQRPARASNSAAPGRSPAASGSGAAQSTDRHQSAS